MLPWGGSPPHLLVELLFYWAMGGGVSEDENDLNSCLIKFLLTLPVSRLPG